MKKKETTNKIALFEGNEIRRSIINDEWVYSVIDVIKVLTNSENPRKYWSVLKVRLKAEGNQTATNCSQLKLVAPKKRKEIIQKETKQLSEANSRLKESIDDN